MFGQATDGAPLLSSLAIVKVSVVVVLMVIAHWIMRNTTIMQVMEKTPWWALGIAWAVLIVALILSQKSSDSFIYFQF
jgi:hypothetical protein